jgi:hypothetical protein
MQTTLNDIKFLSKGSKVRCLSSSATAFSVGKIYELKADFIQGKSLYNHFEILMDDRGSSTNGYHPQFFELVEESIINLPHLALIL